MGAKNASLYAIGQLLTFQAVIPPAAFLDVIRSSKLGTKVPLDRLEALFAPDSDRPESSHP